MKPELLQITPYGFRWGPLEVERTMTVPPPRGGYVLTVRGEGTEIQVYVSRAGRSIRVSREGKELKA